MKRSHAVTLILLFLFTFIFALTLAVGAAEEPAEPQYICCTYTNVCGHVGYGALFGFVCRCIKPGGGQGWANGCLFACPANCNIE